MAKNSPKIVLEHVSCPMCGADSGVTVARGMDEEYYTCGNMFTAVRCESCDFCYLNPRPGAGDLGVIYPDTYHSYILQHAETEKSPDRAFRPLNWITNLRERAGSGRFNNAFKHVDQRLDHIRLLDVGCGDGWLLDKFKRMLGDRLETYGLEINEQVCEMARRKGHRIFWGILEDYPETTKFDIINICHVIEHVPAPRELVVKAASLLNEGGILIVETPNYNAMDRRVIRTISEGCWGGYHFPRHWHFFDSKSLSTMMTASQMTVCSVKYFPTPTTWAWTFNKLADKWPEAIARIVRPFCHPTRIFQRDLWCTFGLAAFYILDRTLLLLGFQTGTIQTVARKDRNSD